MFALYIDPSAGALLIQLLVSAAAGSYVLARRGIHVLRSMLARPGSVFGAFSFANLAMLRIWTELFGFSEPATFEMKALPSTAHYLGTLIGLGVITVLAWPLLIWSARPGNSGRVGSAFLLAAFIVPLNAFRDVLGSRYFPMLRFSLVRSLGPEIATALGVTVLALIAAGIGLFQRPLARALRVFLIICLPVALINAGRASWRIVKPPPPIGIRDAPRAPLNSGRRQPGRVVWLIFDEMDQRITFEHRPAGLQMPEFDRLRASSLYADAVREPADNTVPAIPSMLTGRRVTGFRVLGPARLALSFDDSPAEVDFGVGPNVFRRARELGANAGVVGWGIPYCRVFAEELSRCWWCESVRPDNSVRDTALLAAADQLRSLFETPNFSVFGQSICLRQHTENYFSSLREASALAGDDTIDFSLIHLQGAHPPHVYDRKRDDFSLANSPIRGYTDSLALCDRTLGQLRRRMEERGLWDRTSVLVMSDHHSRSSGVFDGRVDHRVICMVKLPGQRSGHVFERPLSAIIAGDLAIDLLRGTIREPGELQTWLASRAK